MRKIANVRKADKDVARCILHACAEGVFVFPCATLEDGSSIGDNWFESLASAEEACLREYGIRAEDWVVIDDPLSGCQQDWIAPVRVKGRIDGKPQWGVMERLENGKWIEFRTSPHISD
jgi:hypothetical protein